MNQMMGNPMMGQMNQMMSNPMMGQMNPMMGNPIMDSPNEMQQQMMQQQMMQQQMMQQQMQQQMMQQMMQQQAEANAAEMQRQMQEILNANNDYLKFKFKHVNGSKNEIKIRKGKKVKDLLDKYINETFGLGGESLSFLYNAAKFDRNDQRRIEEVFKNGDSFTITVIG